MTRVAIRITDIATAASLAGKLTPARWMAAPSRLPRVSAATAHSPRSTSASSSPAQTVNAA